MILGDIILKHYHYQETRKTLTSIGIPDVFNCIVGSWWLDIRLISGERYWGIMIRDERVVRRRCLARKGLINALLQEQKGLDPGVSRRSCNSGSQINK